MIISCTCLLSLRFVLIGYDNNSRTRATGEVVRTIISLLWWTIIAQKADRTKRGSLLGWVRYVKGEWFWLCLNEQPGKNHWPTIVYFNQARASHFSVDATQFSELPLWLWSDWRNSWHLDFPRIHAKYLAIQRGRETNDSFNDVLFNLYLVCHL